MKIFKITYLIMLIMLSLTSCLSYKPGTVYQTGRSDLSSIAQVSVPFIEIDPEWNKLEVIEEDSFGRVLYKFMSYSRALGELNDDQIWTMLICQKSDKNYTYYYENYSFILSGGDDDFENAEIEKLKVWNDWNKDLDDSKMTKVINDYSPYGRLSLSYDEYDEISINIASYISFDDESKLYLDLIAIDANLKYFFIIREYSSNENEVILGASYFAILNQDFMIESNDCVIKILDIVNCQADMAKIKERCNWTFEKYLPPED